jgi:mono/diheme cytochrome c family protein
MRKKIRLILPLLGMLTLPMLANAGGQELYMKYCKKCHGEAGAGDTPMGKKFAVADYTTAEVKSSITDEAVAKAIKDGVLNEKGKKVMMAFGKKLSDEEVGQIVAYFRTLQKD